MNQRTARETMCVENIGKTGNNGKKIPLGVPTRDLFGVFSNATSYTALSDDEIIELSKYNQDAVVVEKNCIGKYYRVKLFGQFSLNNRCYAVIRPCLCVLGNEDGLITITTAKFTTRYSVARLINRIKSDDFLFAIIYREADDGQMEEFMRTDNPDDILDYISLDRKGMGEDDAGTADGSEEESEDSLTVDKGVMESLKKQIGELEVRLAACEEDLRRKDNLLHCKEMELLRANAEVNRLRMVIQSARTVLMQGEQ